MAYNKTNWQSLPSTDTPISAGNLNKIENGIYDNSVAIDTLNQNVSNITGTILWTNTNPTSDFSTQNITLSSDNYNELIIYCLASTGSVSGNIILSQRVLKGTGTRFVQVSEGAFKYWSRTLNYSTDTSYSINNCIEMTSSGGSNANSNLIPLLVIGLKTGISV